MERCVNCEYYDRRNAKAIDSRAPMWGQCRRHSPQLNPVSAKAYFVEGTWPLVRDDDWCGECAARSQAVGDLVPRGKKRVTPAMAARGNLVAATAAAVVAAAGDD